MARQRITSYHTEKPIEKKMAWERNIRIYASFVSGHMVIPDDYFPVVGLPPDRDYWTLANDQSQADSEIATLVSSNFIKPEQFYGVDSNVEWHDANKAANPRAHFITDDWLRAIRTHNFNPGMVYLDTTEGLTKKNLRLLLGTMECCPDETLLCFNFSENNAYNRKRMLEKDIPESVGRFMDDLANNVLELRKWHPNVPSYRYNQTGHTNMSTLAFFKRGI